MIQWYQAKDFKSVKALSKQQKKPILLDIFSNKCNGCLNLEKNVYNNPGIIEAITQYTIPIRVISENPDRDNTAIINDHIYIFSLTVQLLAHTGTRYHEFNGAPRQTRYSVNYKQTHHEIDGQLTPDKFLAQLFIGLAKSSLRNKDEKIATEYFSYVRKRFPNDLVASNEANGSLDMLFNKEGSTRQLKNLEFCSLSKAVSTFINKAVSLPDNALMADWAASHAGGDWEWYTDSLKEVFMSTYQKLCSFAIDVKMQRGKLSKTFHILSDFHVSYREMTATLFNIKQEYLDAMPYSDFRTLRENFAHCILSEWWAHSPQIRYALEREVLGKEPTLMPAENTIEKYGEPVGTYETFSELFSRYEILHRKLLIELSSITDDKLSVLSK